VLAEPEAEALEQAGHRVGPHPEAVLMAGLV